MGLFTKVGRRRSAHATSSGKVLLAFGSQADVDDAVVGWPAPPRSAHHHHPHPAEPGVGRSAQGRLRDQHRRGRARCRVDRGAHLRSDRRVRRSRLGGRTTDPYAVRASRPARPNGGADGGRDLARPSSATRPRSADDRDAIERRRWQQAQPCRLRRRPTTRTYRTALPRSHGVVGRTWPGSGSRTAPRRRTTWRTRTAGRRSRRSPLVRRPWSPCSQYVRPALSRMEVSRSPAASRSQLRDDRYVARMMCPVCWNSSVAVIVTVDEDARR